ncbi:hypothetical protein Q1695_003855 [Nippostrongylus brasiliensis]|nr:hypothetical protein Q1695_003855 [Nippostrongylus brasiliensis]
MNETVERDSTFVIRGYELRSAIIFVVAFIGVICNSFVALFTRRMKTMNNPFGWLTSSQATAEIVQCSVFAFYYAPMVFFDISFMKHHSNIIGSVLLIFYDICIFSHLVIAANRLCAICFPLKYDVYFSRRNTNIMIAVIWIISFIVPLSFHGRWECNLVYVDEVWAFSFRNDKDCGLISWYADFSQDLSVAVLIAIMDTVTIVKVRLTAKEIASHSRSVASKRKSDINFLRQAVAQGVVYATELFTYFFIAWYVTNKWLFWFCTTMAWVLVHTTDGIVILSFNKEFRRLLIAPIQQSSRVHASNSHNQQPGHLNVNSNSVRQKI